MPPTDTLLRPVLTREEYEAAERKRTREMTMAEAVRILLAEADRQRFRPPARRGSRVMREWGIAPR